MDPRFVALVKSGTIGASTYSEVSLAVQDGVRIDFDTIIAKANTGTISDAEIMELVHAAESSVETFSDIASLADVKSIRGSRTTTEVEVKSELQADGSYLEYTYIKATMETILTRRLSAAEVQPDSSSTTVDKVAEVELTSGKTMSLLNSSSGDDMVTVTQMTFAQPAIGGVTRPARSAVPAIGGVTRPARTATPAAIGGGSRPARSAVPAIESATPAAAAAAAPAAKPCRNGASCYKPGCGFIHPAGWDPEANRPVCNHGMHCNGRKNGHCPFKHEPRITLEKMYDGVAAVQRYIGFKTHEEAMKSWAYANQDLWNELVIAHPELAKVDVDFDDAARVVELDEEDDGFDLGNEIARTLDEEDVGLRSWDDIRRELTSHDVSQADLASGIMSHIKVTRLSVTSEPDGVLNVGGVRLPRERVVDFGGSTWTDYDMCFYLAASNGSAKAAVALKDRLKHAAASFAREFGETTDFGSLGAHADMEVIMAYVLDFGQSICVIDAERKIAHLFESRGLNSPQPAMNLCFHMGHFLRAYTYHDAMSSTDHTVRLW